MSIRFTADNMCFAIGFIAADACFGDWRCTGEHTKALKLLLFIDAMNNRVR